MIDYNLLSNSYTNDITMKEILFYCANQKGNPYRLIGDKYGNSFLILRN